MIDVVMPTYQVDDGGVHLTKMALESLREIPVRIIIVDDVSKMGSGFLKANADVYIKNETNVGFAASVNKGLRVSKTGYVAIANNDVRVDKNWQDVAGEIFKNKKVGSVHFRMIPYDQPFNPGKKTWLRGKERWTHFSFLVIRNRIQKMDPKFYNTFGDWDYLHRLRKKGYLTAYTNKAEFQHLDTYTVTRMPEMTERNKQNYEYFKEKHGEYADLLFAKTYPKQMEVNWKPFP